MPRPHTSPIRFRTPVTTPCRQIHARYLRNNLTPLFNIHPIAYPDVEQSDLLGIVQRRPLHDRSGQLNRFEIRHRRNGSGPPHLKIHRHQPRTGLFGLKLIGNSPTRRLRRIAQPFLIGKTIHLDHHPIGRKRQIVPPDPNDGYRRRSPPSNDKVQSDRRS